MGRRARDPQTGRFCRPVSVPGEAWVKERRFYIALNRKGARLPNGRYVRPVYPILFKTREEACKHAASVKIFSHPYVDAQGREHTKHGRHSSKRLVSYCIESTWVRVRNPEYLEGSQS